MKQKVVVRVQMEDDKKRAKAMKVAVGLPGVLSAAIEGADKDQIVVVGDGVDSIILTTMLRKNVGFADIISVSDVEEKKEEKKVEKPAECSPVAVSSCCGGGYPSTQYYYVTEVRGHHQDSPYCMIM